MSAVDYPSTDPVAAATALAPLIAGAREEVERDGRLPRRLVDALCEAGIFRLWLPRVLGGIEADPETFLAVIEEIARVDGATGWCATVGAVYSMFGAFLAEAPAREVFCSRSDAIVAGTVNPSGRAVAVQGGYRVSGRWSFGSGILHSTTVLGNCIVHDGESPRMGSSGPEMRIVFVPSNACQIIETWRVGGLRGTGSHDYTISDLFVPEEMTVAGFTARPVDQGLLYRYPFIALFAMGIAAPALGIARGAIDALIELAGAKTPTGASSLLRDKPSVQVDVARAEALVQSARAFLLSALAVARAHVEKGGSVPPRDHALLRLAIANATQSAVHAVDLMYNAGGASSLYESCPLERAFRDVHAAAQHFAVAPGMLEIAGRVLLGLGAGTTRF
jgi:alkylation response protein AidB-like acyl-CoA dehydrogenase